MIELATGATALRRVFFGLLIIAALPAPVPVIAQSSTALAGMAAYNTGDYAAAYRLLRQAAKAGDPEAQVNLGYLYARGQAAPVNQTEALRLYQAAAAQGDGEGMNAVGYKYQFGTGIPRNLGLAVEWYCHAVAVGNPRAMVNLGNMLYHGIYLARDVAQARSLWKQAAALGKLNAMYDLAVSYLGGDGLKPDSEKAVYWMQRAGKGGHPDAELWLRRHGYALPLPPPVYEAALMIPAPKGVVGHSKACGALIS